MTTLSAGRVVRKKSFHADPGKPYSMETACSICRLGGGRKFFGILSDNTCRRDSNCRVNGTDASQRVSIISCVVSGSLGGVLFPTPNVVNNHLAPEASHRPGDAYSTYLHLAHILCLVRHPPS